MGYPRNAWHDYVNEMLESDHVKSLNYRRVCVKHCMHVNVARNVSQDRYVYWSISSNSDEMA